MTNNYSVAGFWQGWHASFNRWLVRYMYVPLGGSARKLLNVWPVFAFVGVWHDLESKLMGWALLMALFMLPELAGRTAEPWLRGRLGRRALRQAQVRRVS